MFDFFPSQPRYVCFPPQPKFVPQPQIPALPELPTLKLDVPSFSYNIPKVMVIPFDKSHCNDGKFMSYEEAFDFVSRHVKRHHGQLTKPLMKTYLPLVQVYDQYHGCFIPASEICRRDFDFNFKRVTQKNQ